MAGADCQILDPRVRRTREGLQQSLEGLLKRKEFDQVSVQDIAERAGVNRATFYDHYADKFALLECMVAARFHSLLAERHVEFDDCCASKLNAVVLAVCHYVAQLRGRRARQTEPRVESAVAAVVRRMLLDGLRRRSSGEGLAPEIVAAAASWAIYGAAREWTQTAKRCAPEEIAVRVTALIAPMMSLPPAQPQGSRR